MKELKEKLLAEKRNLQAELAAYKSEDPIYLRGEFSSTIDDSITQAEGHDRIVATRLELKQRLADVEKALQKMEQGTYGVCENCGRKIYLERLRIYPAARFCFSCGEKVEG